MSWTGAPGVDPRPQPARLGGDRLDAARRAWAAPGRRALGVGVLSPLAYVLVLFAVARAPVSYVAPARELSILFGTAFRTTVLAEGPAGRRLFAAAGIVAGVSALALG